LHTAVSGEEKMGQREEGEKRREISLKLKYSPSHATNQKKKMNNFAKKKKVMWPEGGIVLVHKGGFFNFMNVGEYSERHVKVKKNQKAPVLTKE